MFYIGMCVHLDKEGRGEPHNLKINGTFLLPLNILFSYFYSLTSGGPGLVQSAVKIPITPFNVNQLQVEPVGAYQDEARKDFSIRFEKRFNLGGSKIFTAFVNIRNVLNLANITRSYYCGTQFNKVTGTGAPRIFEIATRFMF